MRLHTSLTVVVATVLIVTIGSIGIAAAQTDTDESYWGEHTLNSFVRAWPIAAIAVLAVPLAAGMLGVSELNPRSTVLLLGTIAFLVYHFYVHPRAAILRI